MKRFLYNYNNTIFLDKSTNCGTCGKQKDKFNNYGNANIIICDKYLRDPLKPKSIKEAVKLL